MPFALCTMKFKIDRAESLKEKRTILSGLLTRLKKCNLSVIESGSQDLHNQIELRLAMLRSTQSQIDRDLKAISDIIEQDFPHLDLYAFEREYYL